MTSSSSAARVRLVSHPVDPEGAAPTGAAVWQAPTAERDLVGALILRPSLWAAFDAALVDSRLFVDERHRAVFVALAYVAEQGHAPAISLTSTLTALKSLGLLDQAGGAAYVASLIDGHGGITEEAVGVIVEELRALSTCRWFYYAAGQVLSRIRENPRAVEVELGKLTDQASRTARGRKTKMLTDGDLARLGNPEYLLAPYLVALTLAVLYAPSGLGKTFLALALACALVTGRKFCGLTVPRRVPVIYIPGEGAMGLKRRVDAWKDLEQYNPDDVLGLHIWPAAVHLLDLLEVREFVAEARDVRPGLVIFDTWQRCLGGDENSTADTAAGVAALDRIRSTLNCAALVVHHTGIRDDRERGNTALRASADTMLALKQEDDLTVLRVEKQRDGQQAPELRDLRVRLVPHVETQSMVCVADDGTRVGEFSPLQLKALGALRAFPPDKGATKTEWMEVCLPMPRASFYRVSAKLLDKGVVTEFGRRYRIDARYRNGDDT